MSGHGRASIVDMLADFEKTMRASALREQQFKEEKARLEMELARLSLDHARELVKPAFPKLGMGGS